MKLHTENYLSEALLDLVRLSSYVELHQDVLAPGADAMMVLGEIRSTATKELHLRKAQRDRRPVALPANETRAARELADLLKRAAEMLDDEESRDPGVQERYVGASTGARKLRLLLLTDSREGVSVFAE